MSQARERAVDALEAEAFRLALEEHSPTMVMFLLKTLRRDLYGERVDVRLDFRSVAERVAASTGRSVEEVLEAVERLARDMALR